MTGTIRTVPTLADVEALDRVEMREGYSDGLNGDPEPGDNRSLAYWHGWRNGALDAGRREKDDEQAEHAREYVERSRWRTR